MSSVFLSRLLQALDLVGVKHGSRNKTVAEKAGYSPGTVNRILSGNAALTARFIYLCCTAFGINMGWVKEGVQPILQPDFQEREIGRGASGSDSELERKHARSMAEIAEELQSLSLEEVQSVRWFVGLMSKIHCLEQESSYLAHREDELILQNAIEVDRTDRIISEANRRIHHAKREGQARPPALHPFEDEK